MNSYTMVCCGFSQRFHWLLNNQLAYETFLPRILQILVQLKLMQSPIPKQLQTS